MEKIKKTRDFKSVYKKYLILSLGAVVLMTAVCFIFFFICGHVLNKKISNELTVESRRAVYDAEEHIEGNIKAVSAVSYFIEEDNLSYNLSRLKEAKEDIDCYVLGILNKEGVFYTTENREYDVKGLDCFSNILEGQVIKCEKFEYNGESYLLYGVPVYKGNVIAGGIGLVDRVSDFTNIFSHSGYISHALINNKGMILAENSDLIESYSIGSILSRENAEIYNRAVESREPVLLRETINGAEARIQVMPLSANDCILASIITESGYNSAVWNYFCFILFTYAFFMIVLISVIVFSRSYFKKANASVLELMNRFTDASKILKVTYLRHSCSKPGMISYSSKLLNNNFGYTITEFETLFKNKLEYIIYSEDRNRVFREFEDFAASTSSHRKISFRVLGRDNKLSWYTDEMSKNNRSDEIVSLIFPCDELAELQGKNSFLTKRLDFISRESSYYVFELNIKDRELFVTENLKERLGYVINAQDCFKPSVRERLLSPHSRKELEAMIRSYKRGDRSISGNLTVMAADGSHVRFHIQAEVMGSIIKDETRILAVLNEVKIFK